MVHLLICVAAAGLGVPRHSHRDFLLWAPHLIGLAVMVTMFFDGLADTARWLAVAILLAVGIGGVRMVRTPEQRAGGVIDLLALAVLLVLIPSVSLPPADMSDIHSGHAVTWRIGAPALTAPTLVLIAWAIIRIVQLLHFRRRRTDDAAPATLRRGSQFRESAGSALMLVGMSMAAG